MTSHPPNPPDPALPVQPGGAPAPGSRVNPYVGPRALREGERIFGRDRELRELLNRLIADRLVLLYSPSGAGKSSLVQAGLIPLMRKEKFMVLPIVRVGLEPPARLSRESTPKDSPEPAATPIAAGPGNFNRYVFSAMLALEQELPPEGQRTLPDLAGMSFKDYLAQRPRQPGEPASRLLVFDQFEEILTQAPLDREGKLAFFDQVGEALRDHDLWALFVIREDFLAGLDPYLPFLPTYLRSTFRLDLLERPPAMLAIRNPVETQGIRFQEDAAAKLVEDLSRVFVQQPNGSLREESGLYVEPVQLQVVCRRLYRVLDLEHDMAKTEISAADAAQLGNVNKALGEFYAGEVSEIALSSGVSERSIRDWFGDKLITENLLRGQVLMGEGASGGMDNRVIRLLEDAHLVRAENRRNSTWFELAHDRLVRPIQEDNLDWALKNLQDFQRRAVEWRKKERPSSLLLHGKELMAALNWAEANEKLLDERDRDLLEASREWREQNLNPVQRKAAEWQQQGRPAGLLLSEADLAQAESWLMERPDEASPVEVEYLSASRQAAMQRQVQLLNRRRRITFIAAAAVLASVALVVAVVLAFQFSALANQTASQATQGASTAAANAVRATQGAVIADANATQAYQVAIERDQNAILAAEIYNNAQQTDVAQEATAVALATVSAENFRARNTAEYNASLAQAGRLGSLSQSYFGKDQSLSALLGISAYQAFPDSWEGRDALLTSLQVNSQQQVRPYGAPIQSQIPTVQSLTFSPNGQLLAWSGFEGRLKVWNLERQTLVYDFVVFAEHGVNTLAFSPADPNLLVSGTANGYLTFWNLASGERQTQEAFYRIPGGFFFRSGQLISLAFSPDGRFLAVSGVNGNVVIWDVSRRLAVQFIDVGNITVRKLVWSPQGDRLAGAGYRDNRDDTTSGEVYLWDPGSGTQLDLLPSKDELVYTLDWSPAGDFLAFAGGALDNPTYPRAITLFNTRTRQQIDIPAQERNIRTLAFNQNGQILAAAGEDGTLRLWDISLAGESGSVRLITQFGNFVVRPPLQGLAFAPAGPDRLAYITSQVQISVYDVGLSQTLNEVLKEAAPVLLRPGGPGTDVGEVSGLLAIGYDESGAIGSATLSGTSLTLSTLGAGEPTELRSGELNDAALGPNGLVATLYQSMIRVWDSLTGQPVWTAAEKAGVVSSLAVSPDGRLLAVGRCSSCTRQFTEPVAIYEIGAEAPLLEFGGSSINHVTSLAFSPDMRLLAVGGSNGEIALREASTGNLLSLPFSWNEDSTVTSIAFSPDMKTLATGDQSGNLAVWDIAGRQQVGQTIKADDGPITGLLFSPDNLSLVSAAQNGRIQRWNLDPDSWIERLCALAGRNYTETEIDEFFRGLKYTTPCPAFP